MSPGTVHAITGSVAGLGIGMAFFAALRASTLLYLTNAARRAIVFSLARFAFATLAFGALAALGPETLLPALGAFTVTGLIAGRRAAEANAS
jgi:hypothetical protein